MYWVKYKGRPKEPTEFSNTHNEVTLRSEIKAAHEIELCRKEQKRKGEAIITDDFQVKLESELK